MKDLYSEIDRLGINYNYLIHLYNINGNLIFVGKVSELFDNYSTNGIEIIGDIELVKKNTICCKTNIIGLTRKN